MEGNKGVFFVAQLLLVDLQVTISCMDPMGTTNGCFVTEFPLLQSTFRTFPKQKKKCHPDQIMAAQWVFLLWGKPNVIFLAKKHQLSGRTEMMHWCTRVSPAGCICARRQFCGCDVQAWSHSMEAVAVSLPRRGNNGGGDGGAGAAWTLLSILRYGFRHPEVQGWWRAREPARLVLDTSLNCNGVALDRHPPTTKTIKARPKNQLYQRWSYGAPRRSYKYGYFSAVTYL